MSTSRTFSGVTAAAVGVLSAASIGLMAPAASAAPAYGGTSYCGFTHTTYHPGQTVRFHTGHNFKRRHHVSLTILGPHHFHEGKGGWADRHGEVRAHFQLGKHARHGKYTVVVAGPGGARSYGHFRVR